MPRWHFSTDYSKTGSPMFRIKICGITNVEDAQAVAEAGGDAIGLNFYKTSPRFCPVEAAREISQNLPKHIRRVGVFVNSAAREIRENFDSVGLDLIQIHGDETPKFLSELRGLPVMRAFRMPDDLANVEVYLKCCHKLSCVPRMVLVDAHLPGEYGGTGIAIDWPALAAQRRRLSGMPLVLAGGLNAENVGAAIAAVRPWAVDTASGVEVRKGKKSPAMIHAFVNAAKAAFSDTSACH